MNRCNPNPCFPFGINNMPLSFCCLTWLCNTKLIESWIDWLTVQKHLYQFVCMFPTSLIFYIIVIDVVQKFRTLTVFFLYAIFSFPYSFTHSLTPSFPTRYSHHDAFVAHNFGFERSYFLFCPLPAEWR